ncbi:hypothetical protein FQN60_004798 [Etheostoma spectabile]|uniref:Uncharacterized protein n=1 Tax=Etheostoma spectabile TaxID=54343 RepID=A0A5J5DKP6_9PERO|nr:hypothetical protein FQN60_004798 [Etheostoma spectabile]
MFKAYAHKAAKRAVQAYSSLCWSKNVVALRSVAATSPAQILGPLALFGDTHLNRVKSPEPLFSEQVKASVGTGQRPIGSLWHTSPVCQPARVVGFLVQGFEVKHRVTGALEEDHVTQRSIVEGTVRVSGQPQLTALPGEAGVQYTACVAPHPLPCTPRDEKENMKRGEGSSLDGRREVRPALTERQRATHSALSQYCPVHTAPKHQHRVILVLMNSQRSGSSTQSYSVFAAGALRAASLAFSQLSATTPDLMGCRVKMTLLLRSLKGKSGFISVMDRGVFQSQSVTDLVGSHHEEVVSLVSVKRPPLRHVEVGFPPARQEGPDVCRAFRGLLEHQAGHVAPQLEGNAHCQLHGAQSQVTRPVYYLSSGTFSPSQTAAQSKRSPRTAEKPGTNVNKFTDSLSHMASSTPTEPHALEGKICWLLSSDTPQRGSAICLRVALSSSPVTGSRDNHWNSLQKEKRSTCCCSPNLSIPAGSAGADSTTGSLTGGGPAPPLSVRLHSSLLCCT